MEGVSGKITTGKVDGLWTEPSVAPIRLSTPQFLSYGGIILKKSSFPKLASFASEMVRSLKNLARKRH
jgi:hypothetical protein